MALTDYIPDKDADFSNLLAHVKETLPQYYTALGITAASPPVVALAADAVNFAYLCDRQLKLNQAAQSSTQERNRARYGDQNNPGVPVDLSWPTAPPSVPSPVLPGIEKRLRELTAWLRSLPGYEQSIGEALGLVGTESTPADPATLQPLLTLRLNGGHVEVRWKWGAAAGTAKALYIEVDRGTGPQFLAVDTTPNYTDSTPMPATPAKWKYRAIWQRDGSMIGQWSPWIELNVG